jgi:NodT family efflux transporter outer membrane factor (OMF) lipoprotein
MHEKQRSWLFRATALAALVFSLSGCTSPGEYLRNCFKVGPNYCPPTALVAKQWIDAADVRVRSQSDDLSRWWMVFNDPVLNNLIACAYRQNLTLREAGYRVLESRYQLAIAKGEIFPQLQTASGSYRRSGASQFFSDNWNFGFSLAWELDFWGRFRRAIAAADDQLGASVADYDDVLVTLLSDIATNYVQIRTDQERIKLLQGNVEVQREIYELARRRLGIGTNAELDVQQAESTLRQTEAAIPLLEIDKRQAGNRLCVLLGMPPVDLEKILGKGSIPSAPPEVAVGIPADLLRRRPDIRRAERNAAAQAEQIGIAEAALYPAFTISGNLGYQANNFTDLFTSQAFTGSVGPSFQWALLNYGRIVNNVRYQDAGFQNLVVVYQNTVLQANEEVENGIVTFLRAQERKKILDESVRAGTIARGIATRLYGRVQGFDFNRYATIEQNLISQQDSWAQAQGQIAQGLISIYRALGGGWEMRFNPPEPMPLAPAEGPAAPALPEVLPTPLPAPPADPQQPQPLPPVT